MIIHSPESLMPAPYDAYVRQRARAVASVLEPVVGDTNMQLCPRAILPHEQVFPDDHEAIVYGCVVKDEQQGYKTTLYEGTTNEGIVARSVSEAVVYVTEKLEQGDRVRLKDPLESDGAGQYTAATVQEVTEICENFEELERIGMVVMPHLAKVTDRFVVGQVNLGSAGTFNYFGREYITTHNDHDVFGGSDIVLANASEIVLPEAHADTLDIPPAVRRLGMRVIAQYRRTIQHLGRVNVDVIKGETDSGKPLVAAIDISPRVGGATPAESLAIAALKETATAVCQASVRLLFDPLPIPRSGKNFVETPTLVINANVERISQ